MSLPDFRMRKSGRFFESTVNSQQQHRSWPSADQPIRCLFWKTEHYYTGTDIGMCMNIAKEVSDAMNNQFSAYFWWWIMPNDGATIINGSTPLKNGYTLGQFAHWVRPGMVRVGTTYSPQSGVYVTAYKSPLRIVVVNTTGNWLGQTFTIQNGSVSYLQPFRTSAADL